MDIERAKGHWVIHRNYLTKDGEIVRIPAKGSIGPSMVQEHDGLSSTGTACLRTACEIHLLYLPPYSFVIHSSCNKTQPRELLNRYKTNPEVEHLYDAIITLYKRGGGNS